jgi:hypothetical protein
MKRILALILALALVFGFVAPPIVLAQNYVLEQLLDQTGLTYFKSPQPDGVISYGHNFLFSGNPFGRWAVIAECAFLNEEPYVAIFCTVARRIPAEKFSAELKDWVNDYNASSFGSFLVYNKENGLVNVGYFLPLNYSTPALLRWALKDAAGTAGGVYEKLRTLLAREPMILDDESSSQNNQQNYERTVPDGDKPPTSRI